MSKPLVIVAAVAAVVLIGVGALVVVKRGGDSTTTSPPPPALNPSDMREHNRRQIGDALDAARERGEEARRQSAATQPTSPSTAPSSK
jgi:hypothetical protein